MITFLTSIFTVNYLSGINITGDSSIIKNMIWLSSRI